MAGLDSNTKLLLNMDGADESTTFTDQSDTGHTVTKQGTAQVDTSAKKWGTGSLLTDGDSDYLTIPNSAEHEIFADNTVSYEIDCWVKQNADTTHQVMGMGDGIHNTLYAWDFYYSNGGGWTFRAYNTTENIVSLTDSGETDYTTDWVHLKVVIAGEDGIFDVGLYKNGTRVAQDTSSLEYTFGSTLSIGRRNDASPSQYWNGRVDEVRIQQGTDIDPSADATCTVPTAAYSAAGSASPSASVSSSVSSSPSASVSATPSSSPSISSSVSATPSATPSSSPSISSSLSSSVSASPSSSVSATPSSSVSATPSSSPSSSLMLGATPSSTPSSSVSATPSASPSATPSSSPSGGALPNNTYMVYEGTTDGLETWVDAVQVIKATDEIYNTLVGVVRKTTRLTGATTLTASHHIVFCDTDVGAFEVDLPAGVEGTHYKIICCGTNTLTVDPNGSEELFGAGAGVASTLEEGEVINIHYNATEGWF